MPYLTRIGDEEFNIEILDDRRVIVNGKEYVVDFDAVSDQPVYSLVIDGQSYEALVYPGEDLWQVLMLGRFYPARVEDERDRKLRAANVKTAVKGRIFQLKAPMPGLIIDIPVKEKQQVNEGDVLIILESMKMQNEMKSPKEGIVKRIYVESGESVVQHQTLISVE